MIRSAAGAEETPVAAATHGAADTIDVAAVHAASVAPGAAGAAAAAATTIDNDDTDDNTDDDSDDDDDDSDGSDDDDNDDDDPATRRPGVPAGERERAGPGAALLLQQVRLSRRAAFLLDGLIALGAASRCAASELAQEHLVSEHRDNDRGAGDAAVSGWLGEAEAEVPGGFDAPPLFWGLSRESLVLQFVSRGVAAALTPNDEREAREGHGGDDDSDE